MCRQLEDQASFKENDFNGNSGKVTPQIEALQVSFPVNYY